MAVGRGKMLGHFTEGPGGHKCFCCHEDDTTRRRKRVEAREVAEEIEEEAAMWQQEPDLMRQIAGHVTGAEPVELVPVDPDDL